MFIYIYSHKYLYKINIIRINSIVVLYINIIIILNKYISNYQNLNTIKITFL